MSDLNIVHSDATGEKLFTYAEKIAIGEVYGKNPPDVLANEESGEAYVIGRDEVLALHRDETVYDAVHALDGAGGCIVAPLWEDGSLEPSQRETLLHVRPGAWNAIDSVRDYFPEGWIDDIVTNEEGYEYIDDWSTRGGMIYREKDWQLLPDTGEFTTRPWANENVEEYVSMVASYNTDTIHSPVSVRLLGGACVDGQTLTNYKDQLDGIGFEKVGEGINGMYRSDPNDDPRDVIKEIGDKADIVFRATSNNPFRSTWETWIRRK